MATDTHTAPTVLRDAGYALIGAGDAAFKRGRALAASGGDLPRKLSRLGEQLPSRARGFVEGIATRVQSGFEDLSNRGRTVTGRVAERPEVRRAADQVGAATAKAKAAATSVRTGSDAAPQKAKAAVTSAGRAADAAKTAAKTATKITAGTARSGSDAGGTDTRRYEDRTRAELYDLAVERDLEGRSTMSKDELVAALRADQS